MNLTALFILATLPDGALIAMQVAQIAITVALFLYANQRRDVESLKEAIKKESDKYIDTRFAVLSAQAAGSINLLTQSIDTLKERLCDGDEDLESLLEAKQTLAIRIEQTVASLREYIHETCATKGDVKELQAQVQQVKQAVVQRRGS